MSISIKNNSELALYVSKMDPDDVFLAIKTKKVIEIFDNKKEFDKVSKNYPTAVSGLFNPGNYYWYKF